MCLSLNEAGEFNSLNEYACLRERELVSVCVSQCVCVCLCVSGIEKERVSECVCESVCVCVC